MTMSARLWIDIAAFSNPVGFFQSVATQVERQRGVPLEWKTEFGIAHKECLAVWHVAEQSVGSHAANLCALHRVFGGCVASFQGLDASGTQYSLSGISQPPGSAVMASISLRREGGVIRQRRYEAEGIEDLFLQSLISTPSVEDALRASKANLAQLGPFLLLRLGECTRARC